MVPFRRQDHSRALLRGAEVGERKRDENDVSPPTDCRRRHPRDCPRTGRLARPSLAKPDLPGTGRARTEAGPAPPLGFRGKVPDGFEDVFNGPTRHTHGAMVPERPIAVNNNSTQLVWPGPYFVTASLPRRIVNYSGLTFTGSSRQRNNACLTPALPDPLLAFLLGRAWGRA